MRTSGQTPGSVADALRLAVTGLDYPRPVRSTARHAGRCWPRGETIGPVIRDWTARGIKPVAAQEWSPLSLVGMLTSPRIAGLRQWQGQKFPTSDWPAIIDVDTHEQLVRLFSDPARRKHIVGRKLHLLSGLAPCPKCGHGLKYRKFSSYRDRADSTHACGVPATRHEVGKTVKRTDAKAKNQQAGSLNNKLRPLPRHAA